MTEILLLLVFLVAVVSPGDASNEVLFSVTRGEIEDAEIAMEIQG